MNFSLSLSPGDEFCFRLLTWALHKRELDDAASERLWEEAKPFLPAIKRRQLQSLLYLATGRRAVEQSVFDRVFDEQLTATRQVVGALVQEGCTPHTFKGAELIMRGLKGRALGVANDVDILVPRAHLDRAIQVILQLGYEPAVLRDLAKPTRIIVPLQNEAARLDRGYSVAPLSKFTQIALSPAERPVAQSLCLDAGERADGSRRNRGELFGKGWYRGDHLSLLMEFDLHHRTQQLYAPEMLFERGQPSSLGVGSTFSDSDLLWVAIVKWYLQVQRLGMRRLRQLACIAVCLSEWVIDWDIVLGAADDLGVAPCLYYPLSLFAMLDDDGTLVPKAVLQQLNPARLGANKRWFDFGWQLDKVFDLTVELEPGGLR